MKKIVIALSSVSLILGGCATASKDVATSYVSPMQYQSYDCDQISVESQRIQSRVSQLGGRLDQAAANDQTIGVVGALLFWPALFFLGGTKTQEAEYGRLKGEYDGLQQASIARKCSAMIAQSSEAPAMASNNPIDTSGLEKRLELLSELRAKGILSEDEYKVKRTQLLDSALANTVQFPTSTAKGQLQIEKSSSNPPLNATNFSAGDKLTFNDFDSISGAFISKESFLFDSVKGDSVSFNGGDIVTTRSGIPIKGQTSKAVLFGYNSDGTSSSGKFRITGFKSDQDMKLTFVGPETIKIASRDIRVMRYKIDGYSSHENPNGDNPQMALLGARVVGEMLVDRSSGIVVKLSTKSGYRSYAVSRELVDISK